MTTFSDHDSSQGSDQDALKRLPSRFPIFPLSGAILLPGGNLPLNIFEPRYLQMIKDARRGDNVIGMIQPNGGSDEHPALYPVGCAGKITNFEATEDGRNLITLTGLCRFEIAEELTVATPYRQVIADFEPWQHDLQPQSAPATVRPHLVEALRSYFAVHDISVDWEQIDRAPLEGLLTLARHDLPVRTLGKAGPSGDHRRCRAQQNAGGPAENGHAHRRRLHCPALARHRLDGRLRRRWTRI